jgi:hypothetical protein
MRAASLGHNGASGRDSPREIEGHRFAEVAEEALQVVAIGYFGEGEQQVIASIGKGDEVGLGSCASDQLKRNPKLPLKAAPLLDTAVGIDAETR